MIKWDEFDKIHVVRKIKEVLGSWFAVDVLLVSDDGFIRNFHRGEKRNWSNPLVGSLAGKDAGFDHLCQVVEKANSTLMRSDRRFHEFEYLPGVQGIAFPIVDEGEFLGSVVAIGYKTEEAPLTKTCKTTAQGLGLSDTELEKFWPQVKHLPKSEMQYFRELADLVAQEIVTLHKEISTRENRIQELNNQLGGRYKYESMIGKSKPMQELYSLLDKVQGTESTVLIQGDNGTGKELIAKAIHFNSPRKDNAFVPINCAAFNDNLLESELFGHVKGSFTGAVRDRKGYFEIANGGTLFMDEIGDISQAMQVKLLRVLQDGSFTPVGGNEQKKTKVRIVAATNRNLKKMVEDGTFRQDLFFRLNVIGIQVPSLKDRKEDILLLADHFLAKSAKEKNIAPRELTKASIEKLLDYHWPGNIRELENEMERVTVLSGTETKVFAELLSPRIRETESKPKVQGSRLTGKLKDALEGLERDMIREGLRRTGWNKSKLAKELGISRAGLIMKVEKYGLDKRHGRVDGGATGTDD
jgi:two-component system, NtrC family, response regulator HupR/HoxA